MRLKYITAACVLAWSMAVAPAGTEIGQVHCRKQLSNAQPSEGTSERQYAPDKEVEIQHLVLDVTPDFKSRSIDAKATLRFKPVLDPIRQLKLNAVDLAISSVDADQPVQGYEATTDQLVITFREPIPAGREVTLAITYHATPTQGLYFRTPEIGYKAGDTHLFSQGEDILARHWYPCLDTPNALFTSEVICHVPEGMTVISNGRLISEQQEPGSGLRTFHWSQEQRHANYLITLVAGFFQKLEDRYRDIPLRFYTPPSQIDHASTSFRNTKDMMEFFEKEIGVPYAWGKYDQVCVADFVAGGMENTSATTLTDSTLFGEESENIHNSDGLISHELAHQWFGDLATCKDWSHLWLNEGFATYYETLYRGHREGPDALKYELYERLRMITGLSNDHEPIVRRNYKEPGEMFGYLAYQKGGWVLHMLRAELGEDLYRKCIRTYLERHQHANVVTEDLRRVIEELTGRSYDQFFDQWVYHAHHPELEISYGWDESTKLAKFNVRQVQKIDTNVLVFNVPLRLWFKGSFGTRDHTLQVSRKAEDFFVPLPSAPRVVRIDPDLQLLAKIKFDSGRTLMESQLKEKDDVIGRIQTIEYLAARRDVDAIRLLGAVVKEDPFYAARIEAAQGLAKIHTDEALQALLGATNQSDARVRQQVLANINGFYRTSAFAAARQAWTAEKNPDIRSTALSGVAGYAQPEVRTLLLEGLNSNSWQQRVAVAAIEAMRSQDDPEYIAPLLENLRARETEYTGAALSEGIGTLAYLARNEEKKEAVRDFILRQLESRKRNVRIASITALGHLGDPKAIGAVEKFTRAGAENRERKAAEAACAELRAARRPVDDFKNLRQEVLDLQNSNRELRDQLGTLKKQLDALREPPAVSPDKKKRIIPRPSPKSS